MREIYTLRCEKNRSLFEWTPFYRGKNCPLVGNEETSSKERSRHLERSHYKHHFDDFKNTYLSVLHITFWTFYYSKVRLYRVLTKLTQFLVINRIDRGKEIIVWNGILISGAIKKYSFFVIKLNILKIQFNFLNKIKKCILCVAIKSKNIGNKDNKTFL